MMQLPAYPFRCGDTARRTITRGLQARIHVDTIGLALIYLVYFCARQLAKRKVLSVSMAEALKTQRE